MVIATLAFPATHYTAEWTMLVGVFDTEHDAEWHLQGEYNCTWNTDFKLQTEFGGVLNCTSIDAIRMLPGSVIRADNQ